MIKVNARYFKAASVCMSHEEVRYYLNGVYVQPCAAGGATLTATDGHRLICIHDAAGVCDKPAIVGLPKGALAARWLQGEVTVGEDGLFRHETFVSLKPVVVDGTYPDYRTVVALAEAEGFRPGALPAFNPAYIGDFAKIASLLGVNRDAAPEPIRMVPGKTESDPALVVFPNFSQAFGIVMPIRARDNPPKYSWFIAGEPKPKKVRVRAEKKAA